VFLYGLKETLFFFWLWLPIIPLTFAITAKDVDNIGL
jgi:hypothetical protein